MENSFFVDVAESNIFGYAKAPEGTHWNVFPTEGYVEDVEIQFKLKDGKYSDFMNNDIGLTVCSEKLREVIVKNKSGNDIIHMCV